MNIRLQGMFAVLLSALLIAGSISPLVRPAPVAHADGLWETTKAYTATLADAAKAAATAVAAAAGAVAAATQDVVNAQAAVAAAGGTAAATSAEALAALASAESALVAATAALAAAKVAAATATAIAAAAALGTLIGQGDNWLLSFCWDPICDLTVSIGSNQPIYRPATPEEIDALIPELILLATGTRLGKANFLEAGDAGAKSWDFMSKGAHLLIGSARGAAAFSQGRYSEALTAATDLRSELTAYPRAIDSFAGVLATASLKSPTADLQAQRAKFDSAIERAKRSLDRRAPDYEVAIKQLDVAAKSFTAAQQAVAEAQFPPLVGPQGAFRDLTLPRFQQFLADCSTKGAGCLPPEEVAVVERLLRAAGVSFTGTATVGTMIAQFDAEGGDIGGREGALFAPAGVLNLAELLHRSVQNSVASNGPWLKINLDDSPVVITSRTRVGGTSLPLPQLPVNASTLPNLGPTTLSWVNTAGAVQYQVQVVPVGNDGPGINLIIGDPATVASGAFVIAPPVFGQGNYIILPGATYTWRVRTTSNAGSVTENDPTWGPWSEMRSFTTPRPTAGSIRDFKAAFNNGTATVSWQDQNAQVFYYEVQLSQDSSFNVDPATATAAVYWNLIHGGQTDPLDSWTSPELERGQTYFWRVRQRLQATALGLAEPGVAWSAVQTFIAP